MQDLSVMLKAGCHFCGTPLTPATARCGTMSIKITGSEVWSGPIAILCCAPCEKREGGNESSTP